MRDPRPVAAHIISIAQRPHRAAHRRDAGRQAAKRVIGVKRLISGFSKMTPKFHGNFLRVHLTKHLLRNDQNFNFSVNLENIDARNRLAGSMLIAMIR